MRALRSRFSRPKSERGLLNAVQERGVERFVGDAEVHQGIDASFFESSVSRISPGARCDSCSSSSGS